MTALQSNILAIDAATELCSVAVSAYGELASEVSDRPQSHGQTLLPMVESCLQKRSIDRDALDAVVVTLGPGSFTGVRIGFSVAQGLAYGLGIPLIGRSSLHIMALSQVSEAQSGQILVPCLDARMGEVYWAAYCEHAGALEEVAPAAVSSPEEFNQRSASLGDPEAMYTFGHGGSVDGVSKAFGRLDPSVSPNAEWLLASISDEEVQAAPLSYEIEPHYLRNEVAWEKRKRIRQENAHS